MIRQDSSLCSDNGCVVLMVVVFYESVSYYLLNWIYRKVCPPSSPSCSAQSTSSNRCLCFLQFYFVDLLCWGTLVDLLCSLLSVYSPCSGGLALFNAELAHIAYHLMFSLSIFMQWIMLLLQLLFKVALADPCLVALVQP